MVIKQRTWQSWQSGRYRQQISTVFFEKILKNLLSGLPLKLFIGRWVTSLDIFPTYAVSTWKLKYARSVKTLKAQIKWIISYWDEMGGCEAPAPVER